MRIDLREVGDPIAVIAGGFVARRALHRLVLEDRPEPDRGRAEILDIVEPLGQALQVAAVIEALGGRIDSRSSADRPASPAAIVARVAILEPVGQDEIDHLVLRRARAVVGGRYGGRAGQREQGWRRQCSCAEPYWRRAMLRDERAHGPASGPPRAR